LFMCKLKSNVIR